MKKKRSVAVGILLTACLTLIIIISNYRTVTVTPITDIDEYINRNQLKISEELGVQTIIVNDSTVFVLDNRDAQVRGYSTATISAKALLGNLDITVRGSGEVSEESISGSYAAEVKCRKKINKIRTIQG